MGFSTKGCYPVPVKNTKVTLRMREWLIANKELHHEGYYNDHRMLWFKQKEDAVYFKLTFDVI